MSEKIRLSKLMAERGLCSRREADRFIVQGRVSVDGEVISILGTRIDPRQTITLDQRVQSSQAALRTVLLNKPPGFVSGLPEKGYRSAVLLIEPENAYPKNATAPSRRGLAPAGRLDIDSSGLMVYTQDGRIARKLVGEDSPIEKEYRVRVAGRINHRALALLEQGLTLDGRALKPAAVEHISEEYLNIILTEGRKRQIRRMCALVDLQVRSLVRIRIGRVALGNLPRGKWRYLRPDEAF